MADRHEHAGQRQIGGLAAAVVADPHAGHAGRVAEHLVELVEPAHLGLALAHLVHQLVDQDGLGAELVAAMDHRDLAGDVGQVERLLDRGVAAADHADVLVAVEEAVAGGAGRHALAHEGLLRGQAQVLGRGAGGDDQRIAGVLAGIADQPQRTLVELHRVDVVEDHLGAEALGVLLEARHEVRPLHPVGIGRPVVDVGGRHQLPALGQAGDQHRIQVGAGGIDRGGVAGGAGAEDQEAGVTGCGHDREDLVRPGRTVRRFGGGLRCEKLKKSSA